MRQSFRNQISICLSEFPESTAVTLHAYMSVFTFQQLISLRENPEPVCWRTVSMSWVQDGGGRESRLGREFDRPGWCAGSGDALPRGGFRPWVRRDQ